jgi:prepilin-type N-terminal cleavage/methylation domain-containing protein
MKRVLKKFTAAQQGQSLIEVLVALGILGMVLTAVTTMINSSINNAQLSKTQSLATKYAQQAMETLRGVRNRDYTAFRTYNGTYCLGKEQSVLGSAQSTCSTPNVDNFIRSVQINPVGCSPNVARVTVRVAWTDGKCSSENDYCHNQSHVSCMSTVNPIQAP